jgi:hypothetical protein
MKLPELQGHHTLRRKHQNVKLLEVLDDSQRAIAPPDNHRREILSKLLYSLSSKECIDL